MQRNEKVADFIKELAAEFLIRETNGTSLITVTGATVSPDLRQATILLTVMPEAKEEEALAFAKRSRSKLRDLIKERMKTKIIPFVDFAIDAGEKNRQRIDELLQKK